MQTITSNIQLNVVFVQWNIKIDFILDFPWKYIIRRAECTQTAKIVSLLSIEYSFDNIDTYTCVQHDNTDIVVRKSKEMKTFKCITWVMWRENFKITLAVCNDLSHKHLHFNSTDDRFIAFRRHFCLHVCLTKKKCYSE